MIFGFAKDRPRPPLWVAFVPLLAGLAVYGWFWNGERVALQQDVQKFFVLDTAPEMRGFPYRVSAAFPQARLSRTTGELQWQFAATDMEINRQPWRRELSVARGTRAALSVSTDAWPQAVLDVAGSQMLGSLHVENKQIQRLSLVFGDAAVRLPFVPLPLVSKSFELHVRETPLRKPAANNSPTPPDQAQLRILGPVQIDSKGEIVDLDADLSFTQDQPLVSVSRWRKGGTVEVRQLNMRDLTGFTFLTLNATLAPLPDGRMAIAGTFTTSCPRTVAALFIGMPSPAEYRTRRPQKFAINGMAGAPLEVTPVVEGFTGGPARNREPLCPVLRR